MKTDGAAETGTTRGKIQSLHGGASGGGLGTSITGTSGVPPSTSSSSISGCRPYDLAAEFVDSLTNSLRSTDALHCIATEKHRSLVTFEELQHALLRAASAARLSQPGKAVARAPAGERIHGRSSGNGRGRRSVPSGSPAPTGAKTKTRGAISGSESMTGSSSRPRAMVSSLEPESESESESTDVVLAQMRPVSVRVSRFGSAMRSGPAHAKSSLQAVSRSRSSGRAIGPESGANYADLAGMLLDASLDWGMQLQRVGSDRRALVGPELEITISALQWPIPIPGLSGDASGVGPSPYGRMRGFVPSDDATSLLLDPPSVASAGEFFSLPVRDPASMRLLGWNPALPRLHLRHRAVRLRSKLNAAVGGSRHAKAKGRASYRTRSRRLM